MKKENQNQVVEVENKTAEESKKQFINENMQYVPKNRTSKFAEMTIDEQVEHIKRWKSNKEWRMQWEERSRIINRVKEIFEKRNATVNDAKEVLSYCEDFINNFKQKEIDKLDEEIRKLQEKRAALQG